jgi:hypothetical protein
MYIMSKGELSLVYLCSQKSAHIDLSHAFKDIDNEVSIDLLRAKLYLPLPQNLQIEYDLHQILQTDNDDQYLIETD